MAHTHTHTREWCYTYSPCPGRRMRATQVTCVWNSESNSKQSYSRISKWFTSGDGTHNDGGQTLVFTFDDGNFTFLLLLSDEWNPCGHGSTGLSRCQMRLGTRNTTDKSNEAPRLSRSRWHPLNILHKVGASSCSMLFPWQHQIKSCTSGMPLRARSHASLSARLPIIPLQQHRPTVHRHKHTAATHTRALYHTVHHAPGIKQHHYAIYTHTHTLTKHIDIRRHAWSSTSLDTDYTSNRKWVWTHWPSNRLA